MRLRILAGTLLGLALFAAGALVVAAQLDREMRRSDLISNVLLPLEVSVASLRLTTSRQQIWLMHYIHSGEQTAVGQLKDGMAEIDRTFVKATSLLDDLAAATEPPGKVIPEEAILQVRHLREQFLRIQQVCQTCMQLSQQVVENRSAERHQDMGHSMAALVARMRSLEQLMDEFESQSSELRERLLLDTHRSRARTGRWFNSLIVIALILGVAANVYFYWSFRPIQRLVDGARRIAGGDYEASLSVRGSGELKELAHEFNIMSAALVEHGRELAESQSELLKRENLSRIGELTLGIAHEVRNPLSTIKMTVQALARRSEHLSDFDRERIDLSQKELKRLDSMVTALLEFGRPMEPNRRPVDLRACLSEACRLAEPTFEDRGVAIEQTIAADPVMVRADADHVQQILTNLLLNAAQASESGQVVNVEIRRNGSQNESDSVEVAIRDQGKGIPADELARVFIPFFTHRKGGTGLGLSIAQRLADINGGCIQINSAEGNGTRAVLELPRS